jgi:inorganic pyrophosphatase
MASTPSLPTSLESLPLRDDDGAWLAVIEATQGTRHKFKYRADWKAFVLSGVLPLGLSFPYDFGFVPSTRGEDGDPLDVLVLADEPLPPGTVIPCRLLGVIEAKQRDKNITRSKRNDRLIAAAIKAHRYDEYAEMRDVADIVLREIEQFFVVYNAQKGGHFTPLARRGATVAARLLEQGARRFASKT